MRPKTREPAPLVSEFEYANPVERFAQLPDWKRTWFEELTKEDLDTINEAIKKYRDARTISRFSKWLLLSILAIFIATATFGKNVVEILTWLKR